MAQVAREMGLHENTLYRWVAEFKSSGNQAFPGSGQLKPEDKELGDLQKRIRDLEEENEILKRPCTISQRTGTDLSIHPQTPLAVPCREDVLSIRRFQKRLLRMDETQRKQTQQTP